MPATIEPVIICIGTAIVTEPNTTGGKTISAYPQTVIADAQGNVVIPNDVGGMTQSNAVTAEYYNIDPYSITTPLLAEGDAVMLYEDTTSNVIYWQPFAKGKLRKVAKGEWNLPAKPDNETNDDSSNQYKIKYDTETGVFSFISTQARGEPQAFDIALDTGKATFTFQVDNGELFTWDTKGRVLTLKTETFNIQTTNTNITGDVVIDGNVKMLKKVSIVGPISARSTINAKGGIRARTMRARIGNFPNLD